MSLDDRKCLRGAAFSLPFQLQQRSDESPLVISTWQFSADFYASDGDTVILATSSGLGHWVVSDEDGPEGRVKFNLTEAQTQALPLGSIEADVYRTDGAAGRTQLFFLKFNVRDRS